MNLTEFYPTPPSLIDKMLAGLEFDLIETVLEPSAGKGDIAAAVNKKLGYRRSRYSDDYRGDVDCIEIEPNLRHILEGNKLRVVHDDFLTYRSRKRYDLVIMNPPFSNGDKHFLKALDLQQYGGRVRCLLNAETLRNPHTNTRKLLVRKLEELEAEVDYLTGEFEGAERRTNVEVALVKVDIPNTLPDSIILDELHRAQEQNDTVLEASALVDGDYLNAIIARYNFEVDAGVRLIREYAQIEPYIKDKIPDKDGTAHGNGILELRIHGDDRSTRGDIMNRYVRLVRLKFWEALFNKREFVGTLTSNLQAELHNRVNELADYEFSRVNIREIQRQMSAQTIRGIEDTILALFEDFSGKYAYSDEYCDTGNIHYYNGWKTNKAWKINKKVVIPMYGAFEIWYSGIHWDYRSTSKIADIVKVLDFLGGHNCGGMVERRFELARDNGQTRNINFGHISCTFFKKGTCHITFTDHELLAKFNLYGSQRKGWLPPSYGKRSYKDMSTDERAVIDEFEGEAHYAKVVANPDYYIVEPAGLLKLTAQEHN